MPIKIYVITLEGEPQVAYTDFSKVEDRCFKWLDECRNGRFVSRDFNRWVEGRNYPETEEGEEEAWEEYKREAVDNGKWGDYAWHECYLK
jgi:hypothetical protein